MKSDKIEGTVCPKICLGDWCLDGSSFSYLILWLSEDACWMGSGLKISLLMRWALRLHLRLIYSKLRANVTACSAFMVVSSYRKSIIVLRSTPAYAWNSSLIPVNFFSPFNSAISKILLMISWSSSRIILSPSPSTASATVSSTFLTRGALASIICLSRLNLFL